MSKFIIAGIVFMTIPFATFAQTATTTGAQSTSTVTTTVVDAGLLPGDFLYFLDRWTEALNLAITLNSEKKARKHLEYAKERISEIGKVLENPTATLEDVADAKDDFDDRVAKAASIVKAEKDKGNDVKDLASELDDELDEAQDDLEDMLKDHEDEFSNAEAEIRAKLLSLTPSDPQFQGLTQALESITKEKHDTAKELDDLDIDLDDEQALFEEIMGKEMSSQKHIDEAMRIKAQIDGLVGQIPADVVALSMDILNQAIAADARGDFEAAKKLSKQAKKALENAREMSDDIDDLDDDNDGIPDTKDLDDDNDGIPDTKDMDDDGDDDISGIDVSDLEDEIKKGERMMDDFNR